MPDIPHRLRGAIRALRFASHPDRMTGPYAMALAGLADDIEAGRMVMSTPAEHARLLATAIDLRDRLAAVQRDAATDCADSDAAHAILLDVVGGLVADSPHGGGIVGLARIAAAEVERLRARVADLEREALDLVQVSAVRVVSENAADLAARLAQVERERDEARALVATLDARLVSDGSEVIRLRSELAKPVLGPWLHHANDALCPWSRWSVDGGIIAAVDVLGWSVWHPDGVGRSSGLATGDEGKAAADAAASAFGWRLVGGEVTGA